MKFNVTPCLTVDANQNVSGGLLGEFEHGGSTFRMRVNDSIKDGGNPLDACTLGLKNETMQLSWDCGNNVGRLRMYGGLNVKDKRVSEGPRAGRPPASPPIHLGSSPKPNYPIAGQREGDNQLQRQQQR